MLVWLIRSFAEEKLPVLLVHTHNTIAESWAGVAAMTLLANDLKANHSLEYATNRLQVDLYNYDFGYKMDILRAQLVKKIVYDPRQYGLLSWLLPCIQTDNKNPNVQRNGMPFLSLLERLYCPSVEKSTI